MTDCRCFSEERATATKYRKTWGAERGQKTPKIYEGFAQIGGRIATDCRCFCEERATATKYRKIWGAESGQKTTKIYEGLEQIKVEL